MDLVNEFIAVFGVWEVAQPYLHLIVTEDEMRLVTALKNDILTQEEIGDCLGSSPDQTSKLLEQAYARCVVNKQSENNVARYESAGFSERLDYFAKYENWHDIPPAARTVIDRRFLDEFINQHRENVLCKLHGEDSENSLPNDTVMLLEEVEAMVKAAECIVVQPCDCRRLGENCARPVETCIWLDEGAHQTLYRGQGRQINQEQALELLRWADRKGLMHTADSD